MNTNNTTTSTPTPVTAVFCQVKTVEGEYIRVFDSMGIYLPLAEKTASALVNAVEKEEGLEQFTLQFIYNGGGRTHLVVNKREISPEFPGWEPEELVEWERDFLLPEPEREERPLRPSYTPEPLEKKKGPARPRKRSA